ncbi:hypothetical protein [Streptomyces sp. NPDC096152]|uniref:hypothetical protein n=1 Tax=Streptomyces sp. NPDC096152 TaxID=3366078 RepID=UPI0038304B0C
MTSDVTCEQLREIGAELALGVLPGLERSGAVAHLDRCAECREYVEQLTFVGDRLIGLLPGSEPPVGFEARVAQALTSESSTHEGRRTGHGFGLRRRSPGGRTRVRWAAAAAAFALAFGFGGWAVGTAIEGMVAGPAGPAEQQTGLVQAQLVSAHAVGRPTGEVYLHPGSPSWIYMYVDLADAGTPYTGRVDCLLERGDGGTVRAGSFALRQGYGYWGGPSPVASSALSKVRLASSDGTVLATARFPSSDGTPNVSSRA